MKIRKGDEVLVIAGNDKGKTGSVLEVDRVKSRVLVEGVNLRWKHERRTEQKPQGERIQREFTLHASNVMLLDPKTGKGIRKRQ